MKSRYARPAHILLSGDEGSRYVTDSDAGVIFELNETAYLVLAAATAGSDLASLAEPLLRAFPTVPREEIERDVAELVAQLVQEGLLAHEPRA